MPRATWRELAIKKMYAISCGGDGTAKEIWEMTAEEGEKTDRRDFRRADTIVDGVCEHQQELDHMIEAHLKSWSLSRLDVLDLCALRVAVYEMKYCEDIPESVSIKEAIAFADEYCGEKSDGFINGVLGQLLRSGLNYTPPLEATPLMTEFDESDDIEIGAASEEIQEDTSKEEAPEEVASETP